MEKTDARKFPREAQEEIRRQAMRLREKLNLTWKEVARVTGGKYWRGAVVVKALWTRWRGRIEISQAGAA
jgi:hypothetical protein